MHRYGLIVSRHRALVLSALGCVAAGGALAGAFIVLHHHSARITDFNSCITAGYDASDSDPQTCTNGHQTFVGPRSAAPTTSTETSGSPQDYTILVSGDSRGDYAQSEQVIRTQAQWVAFWAQVHARLPTAPPILPVDFSTQMVIAITQGVKPTTGYGLDMSGILTGAKITVNYDQIEPAAGCTETQTPTDNYLVVETATSPADVSFQPTVKTMKC